MKHSEFKIGGEFTTGSGRWRCTDVGTRVIVAVKLGKPENMYNGPPYKVAEDVFDEYDMDGCEPATTPQESLATPGVQSETGKVLTGEPAAKNPLDNHHPDWVRHALWCIKENDFLQIAQTFTYLVETSNDWEDLKDDPLLLLLVHRIYKWCSNNSSADLLYRLVMASDSDLGVEIDSDACQKKVDEWLKEKGR